MPATTTKKTTTTSTISKSNTIEGIDKIDYFDLTVTKSKLKSKIKKIKKNATKSYHSKFEQAIFMIVDYAIDSMINDLEIPHNAINNKIISPCDIKPMINPLCTFFRKEIENKSGVKDWFYSREELIKTKNKIDDMKKEIENEKEKLRMITEKQKEVRQNVKENRKKQRQQKKSVSAH
mgnify:CR=1 FL=1